MSSKGVCFPIESEEFVDLMQVPIKRELLDMVDMGLEPMEMGIRIKIMEDTVMVKCTLEVLGLQIQHT